MKGPIPATWLIAAARLPGKALHVGLALWQRAGVSRSSTVSVGGAFLTALELDKSSKSRALRALEGAGLIVVTRAPGRVPVVTIVEAPPEPPISQSRSRRG